MRNTTFRRSLFPAVAAFVLLPVGGVFGGEEQKPSAGSPNSPAGMVAIPGGVFRMGSSAGLPDEKPVHSVRVSAFWIDAREVTVAQFAAFIEDTGYVTDAEKIGWSGVFSLETGAWTRATGASWRSPDGIIGQPAKQNEPVVQVSWRDATAYARWAGKRLPTEAEWEWAARGGLQAATYPWGVRPPRPTDANLWQGIFPRKNTGTDGFLRRAPVGSFAANGYGLFDMSGNVWEWCGDTYDATYYRKSAKDNPGGAKTGEERSIRGGSFLCQAASCHGFRVSARSHSDPQSGLNHLGFRCVRSTPLSAR